jgi:uncharacterized protein DUF4386
VTRRANARLAGAMFLLYIVTGLASLALFNRATGGAVGPAATLASIVQHAGLVRLTALLNLLTFFDAMLLAVAIYALTRDLDRDLALVALCCRVAEGVFGAVSAVQTLQLLAVAQDAATQAFGALLLRQGGQGVSVAATLFAVGSTIYCYLFLRARSIPVSLAWLGLAASVLLLVALPLRIVGVLEGPVSYYVWIPMALFEIVLGLWLLIKGVEPA